MLRVGHKGADALVSGNSIASFQRAVEVGVDVIEFDVLWTPAGSPRLPAPEREPLVVAHDWDVAAEGHSPTLAEALDAFCEPPLDEVEIDCDIKLPGREHDLVAALRERDLVGRAMVSTPHLEALSAVAALEPGLRLGWTYPKVKRAWDQKRWARPLVIGAVTMMRSRLPGQVAARAAELGLYALWPHHSMVTPRLVAACRAASVRLITWTVDEPARVAELRSIGVDGICSNDPRLLQI